jgi:hypothetical protein
MSSPAAAQARELTSWKEVAEYLGVSVRTAQRWAVTRGLPVRKLGSQRGRVVALVSELEHWRQTSPQRPDWWHSLTLFRVTAVGVTVVAAGALAVVLTLYFTHWRPGQPAQYRTEGRYLVVLDARGVERWRYAFPYSLLRHGNAIGYSKDRVYFAPSPVRARVEGEPLHCFSSDGRLLWTFDPATKAPQYPPPFRLRGLRVLPDGRVVTAYAHHYGAPSQIAALDAAGRLLATYWYPGDMGPYALEVFEGQVLVGGVHRERRQAVLVVLDAARLTPRAEVRFPRTPWNTRHQWANRVQAIRPGTGALEVLVEERLWTPGVTYRFDERWKVTGVRAPRVLAHELGDHLDVDQLRHEVEVVRQ